MLAELEPATLGELIIGLALCALWDIDALERKGRAGVNVRVVRGAAGVKQASAFSREAGTIPPETAESKIKRHLNYKNTKNTSENR